MIDSVAPALSLPFPCPLSLHAPYTRDEVLAALGHWTRGRQREMREGVLHLPEIKADVFFVTLHKTEEHFSPTTMYRDYAVNERLFHWQSQSTTSAESPTGRRYIGHAARGLHGPAVRPGAPRPQRPVRAVRLPRPGPVRGPHRAAGR